MFVSLGSVGCGAAWPHGTCVGTVVKVHTLGLHRAAWACRFGKAWCMASFTSANQYLCGHAKSVMLSLDCDDTFGFRTLVVTAGE